MNNYDDFTNALMEIPSSSTFELEELSRDIKEIKKELDAKERARRILIKHLEDKKEKRQTKMFDPNERIKQEKDLDKHIKEQTVRINSPNKLSTPRRRHSIASSKSKDNRSKEIQNYRMKPPIFSLSSSLSSSLPSSLSFSRMMRKKRRSQKRGPKGPRGILKQTKHRRSNRKNKRVSFGNCPCIL
jgi:type I site-specific restriction-modification system R (restriction) subunit